MKGKKILSILLVLTFIVSMFAGWGGTPKAYASYERNERSPEEIVLDFSFFNLNPESDKEKYAEGVENFLMDASELIQTLLDAYFVEMDQYVACAQALNFPKVFEYLNQDKNAKPLMDYLQNDENGQRIAGYFDNIYNFQENYQKVFENNISGQIDELLEEAEGKNKQQVLEAIDLYKKAIEICDTVLFNLPDYNGAKSKKTEAQNALSKLIGSMDKSVFSSDVHKNNVGNILFSNNIIKAGKETASQFKANFTASDSIYAIAYLPLRVKTLEPNQSLGGTYTGYETVEASAAICVDGVESMLGNITVPVNVQDYQSNKGYITFDLLPDPKNAVGYNQDDWYHNIFKGLTPGVHNIYIELTLNDTKIAAGDFNIDWTKADLKKISKNIDQATKNAEIYRANLRKMPDRFKLKSKAYKDPILSDKKIKALIMKKFPNAANIIKYVNIGDNSTSWSIEKNDLGIPKARYSTMETWVLYKGKDGWGYITQIKLKCSYAGGGTYGEPFILVELQPAMISLKNVK